MSRLRQLRAQQAHRARQVRRLDRAQARLDMVMMSLMATTKKSKSEIQSDRAGIAIWRESGTINPKERPRWGVLSVALYQDFDR